MTFHQNEIETLPRGPNYNCLDYFKGLLTFQVETFDMLQGLLGSWGVSASRYIDTTNTCPSRSASATLPQCKEFHAGGRVGW
jgi:hypothetical protein